MRRYFATALCLMALLGVFTGCGCSNVSTSPNGSITETTRPSSPMPTATHETTRPTTNPTESTGMMEGIMDDMSEAMTEGSTSTPTSPSTGTEPKTRNRMR